MRLGVNQEEGLEAGSMGNGCDVGPRLGTLIRRVDQEKNGLEGEGVGERLER